MMTALILAAALTVPGEAELKAKLPEIFRGAVVQYRHVLKAMEKEPADSEPGGVRNGRFCSVPPVDWTSGFFPGSLWYLYEATGDVAMKDAAVAFTERLIEPLRHDASNHDVGFRTYCSAGNALRLTGEARYADFLHDTAAALRTRYDEGLGLIRSWDTEARWTKNCFTPEFIVIIDNMMNLELLEWDAKNGGDPASDRIARSQADLTDLNHFRTDGSAYHILGYNPKTRKIQAYFAGQGASADGTWARGQAWAIYGFTVMYRETRDPRYLARACKAADYWLDEPNLPEDGIPYWDFKASGIPNEERDASAAAVTASALLELSEFVTGDVRRRYFAAACRILLSLSSSAYTAAEGTNEGYLLLHSVGNKPGGSNIDVPLTYADYYYLEALLRYRRLAVRAVCAVAPFAPGERVAFLGDSITRQAWYLGYLQLYANLAVKGGDVKLVNVGVSGDTAAGALERYEWDVRPVEADRVFVMFGMNDVKVTLYDGKKPDAERLAEREQKLTAYARNLRTLVDRLRADGRQVVLMTPTPYDEYSKTNDGTLFADANEKGLSRCAEIVRHLAAEERIPCIDLYRPLTAVWRNAPEPGYTRDRVHPNETGARLAATEILKAMGVAEPSLPTNGPVYTATMDRCQAEAKRRILPQVKMDIERRGGKPADRASFEATVKAWRAELEARTDWSEKDRRHYLDYFTGVWDYYRKEMFGSSAVFDVADFGAKSSDRLMTAEFQAAIDACWKAGGGEVRVPAGTYLTGGLRLRSNVTLRLLSGAILEGSRDPEDYCGFLADELEPVVEWPEGRRSKKTSAYPYSRWNNGLIRAIGAHDVAIVGEPYSYIDGMNCYDEKGEEGYRGPHAINFWYCTNVVLRGYTVRNSANWAHAIQNSANIDMRDVTVLGGHDGFDVRSCDDVSVSDCTFRTGDDAIAGFDNIGVRVRNCLFDCACNALRFGGTDVVFENCRGVSPASYGHRYLMDQESKSRSVNDGRKTRHDMCPAFNYYCDFRAVIRRTPGNILLRNCTFENPRNVFALNFDGKHQWCCNRSLESIRFENCSFTGVAAEALCIVGDAKEPLTLEMKDCTIAAAAGSEKRTFATARHFRRILLENVTVSGYAEPSVVSDGSGKVVVRGGTTVKERRE